VRESFDYVIVGAGPAGCLLANRLSANASIRVALLESGPVNRHFLIDMPKGFGRLLVKSPFVMHYPTQPDPSGQRYVWARGRTLGGSTSINGMAYSRGQPVDYDDWEALGATGWNWQSMLSAFRAIEDHELGANHMRGSGGPMHVSINRIRTLPNDAALAAAQAIGLPVREDVNGHEDQSGIGPMPQMIRHGRRMSAADAFLRPAAGRSNLSVFTGAVAYRIRFDGRRAVGVEGVRNGQPFSLRVDREVLCCAGAFETPKLLLLSGIGPASHLEQHGIAVVQDSPGVGENMAEHRGIALQYRLRERLSHNPQFSGLRLTKNTLQYLLFRTGIMSYGSHELMGFAQVRSESGHADTQFFASPFSRVMGAPTPKFEAFPGMQCLIYPTRPTSRGSVRLRSADPADMPAITPNLLSTEEDRATSTAMVRFVRRWFATQPLRSMLAEETFPGTQVDTDEQILDAVRKRGTWGFHTCGTARMGRDGDPMAVLDSNLRVRGVERLRVIDASSFPAIVSANTTAPVLALAWRAADSIAESN